MFQIEWAQKGLWLKQERLSTPASSQLNRSDVRKAAVLQWEEHCLECTMPICFTTCALYVVRADRKCSRFVYGIYPHPSFRGLFDFGADIRFRRWGKLEALYHGKSATLRAHRFVDMLNRMIMALVGRTPEPGAAMNFWRRLTAFAKTTWSKLRDKFLVRRFVGSAASANHAFVMECFSVENLPFRLMLEYSTGSMTRDHTFLGQIRHRQSFDIAPGWNFYTLPGEIFALAEGTRAAKITIYPENNVEARLIFTWLDLVEYCDASPNKALGKEEKSGEAAPAAKVKCVAWDLDNTLWRGILAEANGRPLEARPEALELITKLDERGILQTIASKNNNEDAWPIIERLNLQEYFLYPAINWAPKSSNLKQIADNLNINIDTFALIDDSAFERAEVRFGLPQVRVYSDDQIGQLLSLPEFDVPVTETSKNRRASYLTEIQREKVLEDFHGDYEAFLRSCQMKLRLFVPQEEKHIARCLELIQRSNQLNLSNTRYSAEEFRALLARPGVLCLAMDCEDKFGDYGIVGFASVDETERIPTLCDLVLSCRVAQKRVEHTFVEWLGRRELDRGITTLAARLFRTPRNQPIRQVFDDLRFHMANEEGDRCLMEWPLASDLSVGETVKVEDSVPLPARSPHSLSVS